MWSAPATLQFILNVDTLTKSRVDAEEERLEREAERVNQGHRLPEVSRRRQLQQDDDESQNPDEMLSHYEEDCMIPLERYIMYNNPRVKSFPTQKYVAGALSAGRVIDILPSYGEARHCLNADSQTTQAPRSTPFQIPNFITEEKAKLWADEIKEDVRRRKDQRTRPRESSQRSIFESQEGGDGGHGTDYIVDVQDKLEKAIEVVAREQNLNTAQLRGYHIFLNGLRCLAGGGTGSSTHNRCMYLGGPGGTGKTKVIGAIVTLFDRIGCPEKLMLSATTGVAADIINGSTIHSLCHLGRGNQGDEDVGKVERMNRLHLDNSWTNCEFLVIDEMSMVGCKTLNEISTNLCSLKNSALPFGGLYVLFTGDLHQLPCIGDRSLYIDCRDEYIKVGRELSPLEKNYIAGTELWDQATRKTVLLTQHYRAPNEGVHGVLDRIRGGRATPADIEIVHSRTFGHPDGPNPTDAMWKAAPLITPRNSVRQAWNNQAGIKHAVDTGNQIFISPSIDTGVPANYSREEMVWTVDSKTEMLATWAMLCVGAVAVVTTNIAVELRVANGTKVIIREVVPHPNDIHGWNQMQNQVVRLSQPPICVFVELTEANEWSREFRQGEPRWFPIMRQTERVKLPKDSGTEKSFQRTQIPLTSAFSLSDHKVQGKGLRNSILDLHRPPTGSFKIENLYVMLSRTSNWEDVAILRPFDDRIFNVQPNEKLLRYDIYLEDQDKMTQQIYEGEMRTSM